MARFFKRKGFSIFKNYTFFIEKQRISVKGSEPDFIAIDLYEFIDIYEIKTDSDIRRGLREAIGQLLDYATWEKGVTIKNIHAVLPYSPLSDKIKDFIQRIKSNININLEILFYDKTTKTFSSTK